MKIDIKIPPLGESVSEATVARILKPSGSAVRMDEEIVELETDKVNQPLYAPQNGTVEWKVQPGDTVRVGQVIGAVDTEGKATIIAPCKAFASRQQERRLPPGRCSEGERATCRA